MDLETNAARLYHMRFGAAAEDRALTTFHISFGESFEQDTTVAVSQEGELPEFLQIWIWDLYYASTLHALGSDPAAQQVRDTLEGWAGTVVGNILDPVQKFRQQGLLTIDVALKLLDSLGQATQEVYTVDVQDASASGWPDIRVESSRTRRAHRMAYSAIALAQFFLGKNMLFAKELPLHILSMRKYYEEQRTPSEDVSRMEAPLYALNKAMKFFEDINKSDDVTIN